MESTQNLPNPPQNVLGGPGGADLGRHLAGMWAAVAPSWKTHAEYVDQRARPISDALLGLAAPIAGENVLELACGPGGVGLAAAAIVGETGYVVLSDVVPEMTAIAAARIKAQRINNASTKVLDLMAIAEPDASYDVVLCREGLMFVPDPDKAAREIARVLKPGGRFAVAVWGPRDRNPWLGLVFDAVAAQTGRPIPPPGIPGPFSLADNGLLKQIFVEAGFATVTIGEAQAPMQTTSFDEWWERTRALAGPLSKQLAEMPPTLIDALRARLQTATAPFVDNGAMHFPGVSLLVSGRKAG
jgi:SAM-dependent methyltransferase